ncbi:hypothetical protein ABPG74_022149 [Tetrahymena malaccensis]
MSRSIQTIRNLFTLNQFNCALNHQNSKINAKFAGKFKINEDHYHFRFFLDNPDLHLGTKVGQAVKVTLNSQKENQISRYYSLVSDPFSKGYFDCIVKDLDKSNYTENSNPMVPQLLQLKDGAKVVIEDPYTQYIYHGLGNLTYKKNFKSEFQTGKFDKIGIIAHNSAITTFSQLIQGVISARDPTQINLLFHNHKIQDEILLDEMTRFFLSHNMKYTTVLQNAKQDYYGFTGDICEKSIVQTLPSPRENYVIMIQGPRPFKEQVYQLLLKMGYDSERIAYM